MVTHPSITRGSWESNSLPSNGQSNALTLTTKTPKLNENSHESYVKNPANATDRQTNMVTKA